MQKKRFLMAFFVFLMSGMLADEALADTSCGDVFLACEPIPWDCESCLLCVADAYPECRECCENKYPPGQQRGTCYLACANDGITANDACVAVDPDCEWGPIGLESSMSCQAGLEPSLSSRKHESGEVMMGGDPDPPGTKCCCDAFGECRYYTFCDGYDEVDCPCMADSCDGGPIGGP
jgi:hypothetical protein